jgi:cobalt-zinc-cadmium efflux system membrane fusion protein
MKKTFIIISFTMVIATFYIASAIGNKNSFAVSSDNHGHADPLEHDSHSEKEPAEPNGERENPASPQHDQEIHDSHKEHEKEESHDDHDHAAHQHDHGVADLDRSVDEMWTAKCEHNILHYTCDECRYELGVVKLSPALLGGAGTNGIVSITTAESKDFSKMLSLTGEITTNESKTVRVSSPESGIARSSIADIGQKVAKGDVLLEIDSREVAEAKAAFLKQLAILKLARKNAEREAALFAKKISAEVEVQEAKTKLAEAEIEVANIKAHLTTHGISQKEIEQLISGTANNINGIFSIRAPQNGIVLERYINAGEQIEPGKELFLISDLSEVWVWANIKEEELLQVTSLKENIVAEVQVPGLVGKKYRGVMDVVSGKITEQTRSARARLSVVNPDGLLRPGMFVNIRLLLPGTQQTILVPQVAVLSDEGRQFVFVHKEGDYWVRRPVTTGDTFNDQVSIMSGLTPGQKIIADGSFMLKSDVLREKMGAGCAD